MEKKTIKFKTYFLWMFVIPLAAAAVITVIFCLLQKNYYYLPYNLDFLIQLSYDTVYYALFAGLFISIGILTYSVLYGDKKTTAGTTITGFMSVALLPLLTFLVKIIFIGGDMSSDTLWDYFYSDLLCTLENGAKYLIAVIVVFAIKIYFVIKKQPIKIKKPYILPTFPLSVSLLIIHFSWLTVSIIGFITSDNKAVGSLLYEIGLTFAGYFIGILPAVFFERKKEKRKSE